MFEIFSYWLLIFFTFNVMGWILESAIESLYHKRLINRGFLRGPYIPIYGVGGIMLANVCMPFRENGFVVFAAGMCAATTLEYCAGSILERIFKKQFWDYSMLPFTYKNRVSLLSSLFWGVQALFMVYVLYDFISPIISAVNPFARHGINAVMTVIMGADAFFQIRRQENIDKILAKLSYEQVREVLIKTIMQIGNPSQVRAAFMNRFRPRGADGCTEEKQEEQEEQTFYDG
ncbi:MAG: putative ABC transporter permease [Oscillospiraceae bacterium]|jgi:uncharacterized membrane protein|nr:putative ABC transporter permease [Oscillospiraceae bacterium]